MILAGYDFCDVDFKRSDWNSFYRNAQSGPPPSPSAPSGPPPEVRPDPAPGSGGGSTGGGSIGGTPELPPYVPPTKTPPLKSPPGPVRVDPRLPPEYRDPWNKRVLPITEGDPTNRWARIIWVIGKLIDTIGKGGLRIIVPIIPDPNLIFPRPMPIPRPIACLGPDLGLETPDEFHVGNGEDRLIARFQPDMEVCEVASQLVGREYVLQGYRGRRLRGNGLT